MSFAVYEQDTGRFVILEIEDGGLERCLYECGGHSGCGDGRNQHALQGRRNVGPIPVGFYRIVPHPHPRFRHPAFKLTPFTTNVMFGRDGFWIHGGEVSHGCIILPRSCRDALLHYNVQHVEVVPPNTRREPPQT